MYVYMYMYMNTYIHAHTYICSSIPICTHVHAHTCAQTSHARNTRLHAVPAWSAATIHGFTLAPQGKWADWIITWINNTWFHTTSAFFDANRHNVLLVLLYI